MNVVIFSDVESTGKWLAMQALLAELKMLKPDLKLHLLYYGINEMMLDRVLFASMTNLPRPPLVPPFRYYRQAILELFIQIKTLRSLPFVGRPDAIITTEYSFVYATKLVLPSTRLIFHFHGFTHFFSLNRKNFNFYLFLIKTLERVSWLLADKMILPSTNVYPVIQKELGFFYNRKKIQVIGNVLPEYFKIPCTSAELIKLKKSLGIGSKRRILLYVGRISEKKGLENFFAAIPRIRKSLRNMLVIVTYPDFTMNHEVWREIQTLIDVKNLRSSVLFLKNYDRQKLPALYQLADLAILPSELEMNSLFLLESLVSGLPILSTTSGNARHVLGKVDVSLLLKNNQPVTIARSVTRYFSRSLFWQQAIKKKLKIRFEQLYQKKNRRNLLDILTG